MIDSFWKGTRGDTIVQGSLHSGIPPGSCPFKRGTGGVVPEVLNPPAMGCDPSGIRNGESAPVPGDESQVGLANFRRFRVVTADHVTPIRRSLLRYGKFAP